MRGIMPACRFDCADRLRKLRLPSDHLADNEQPGALNGGHRSTCLDTITWTDIIPQRVIPVTQRRAGWARLSTTPGSRSRTMVRSAPTATRYQTTILNLPASIATRALLHTGPECRILTFAVHPHRAGTEPPSATTATRTAAAKQNPRSGFQPVSRS
jgi:hypothetical protein